MVKVTLWRSCQCPKCHSFDDWMEYLFEGHIIVRITSGIFAMTTYKLRNSMLKGPVFLSVPCSVLHMLASCMSESDHPSLLDGTFQGTSCHEY